MVEIAFKDSGDKIEMGIGLIIEVKKNRKDWRIYCVFHGKNQKLDSLVRQNEVIGFFAKGYNPLPIPEHGNAIKAVYVKQAVAMVESIKEKEGNND